MVVGRSTRADRDQPIRRKRPAVTGEVVQRRSTRATADQPPRRGRIEEKIAAARERHPSTSQPQIDPSVEWSARLSSPTSAARVASVQPVTVAVAAPVVLGGQKVRVGVEPRIAGRSGLRWQDAVWSGDPGQHRTVAAVLGRGELRLPKGLWRVVVNIDGVTMNAGQVVIT